MCMYAIMVAVASLLITGFGLEGKGLSDYVGDNNRLSLH